MLNMVDHLNKIQGVMFKNHFQAIKIKYFNAEGLLCQLNHPL
jgi:hypothetical protein